MAVIEATGSLPKPAFSVSAQTREAPAVMHSQARPAMPASASGAAAEWTSQPAAGTAAGTSPSHAHPDAVLSSVSPASRPPIRPRYVAPAKGLPPAFVSKHVIESMLSGERALTSRHPPLSPAPPPLRCVRSSPDRHAPAAHASNRLRPSLPLDPRELKVRAALTERRAPTAPAGASFSDRAAPLPCPGRVTLENCPDHVNKYARRTPGMAAPGHAIRAVGGTLRTRHALHIHHLDHGPRPTQVAGGEPRRARVAFIWRAPGARCAGRWAPRSVHALTRVRVRALADGARRSRRPC